MGIKVDTNVISNISIHDLANLNTDDCTCTMAIADDGNNGVEGMGSAGESMICSGSPPANTLGANDFLTSIVFINVSLANEDVVSIPIGAGNTPSPDDFDDPGVINSIVISIAI